ncbi:unnamed protein product [Heligmosomoides polygyrus]|uniref:Formate dehydrogenase n=1 Tax=Heligmosomoides polygyrus TaxID=6339 RepID=A0A183FYA2_HELPZ|nr:unnamed protein product [Heligmosomoides polygyrus]
MTAEKLAACEEQLLPVAYPSNDLRTVPISRRAFGSWEKLAEAVAMHSASLAPRSRPLSPDKGNWGYHTTKDFLSVHRHRCSTQISPMIHPSVWPSVWPSVVFNALSRYTSEL